METEVLIVVSMLIKFNMVLFILTLKETSGWRGKCLGPGRYHDALKVTLFRGPPRLSVCKLYSACASPSVPSSKM